MRNWKRRSSFVIAAAAAGAVTLAAASASTGSGGSPVTPAGAPAARTHARLLAEEANAAFLHYLTHQVTPGQAARSPRATTAEYYNWSGYADTSKTKGAFTKVSGGWKEPTVTCSPEDQIVATWVGIDGYSDTTVEQVGADAQCFEGTAYYYTWYEMFPSAPVVIGDTVAPGDSLSASVVRSGTKYTLSITDSTHTANSGSAKETCAATKCIDTSAEWISERPEYATTGDVPLAHYGTWTLSSGAVTSGGKTGTISSFKPVAITMVDSTGTYPLSTPSALTGGKSFTTTWDDSY